MRCLLQGLVKALLAPEMLFSMAATLLRSLTTVFVAVRLDNVLLSTTTTAISTRRCAVVRSLLPAVARGESPIAVPGGRPLFSGASEPPFPPPLFFLFALLQALFFFLVRSSALFVPFARRSVCICFCA